MRITTRKGDDGTTGLLYGGRVPKDSPAIEANGAVDEAQAALGLARAEAGPNGDLAGLLLTIQRHLWTLMGELATEPDNRHKLEDVVTGEMVDWLEARMDDLEPRFEMPTGFVVPGENRVAALLDLARTVVRRAERACLAVAGDPSSRVVPYLNRLSDLLWTMARWQEGHSLPVRPAAGLQQEA